MTLGLLEAVTGLVGVGEGVRVVGLGVVGEGLGSGALESEGGLEVPERPGLCAFGDDGPIHSHAHLLLVHRLLPAP